MTALSTVNPSTTTLEPQNCGRCRQAVSVRVTFISKGICKFGKQLPKIEVLQDKRPLFVSGR